MYHTLGLSYFQGDYICGYGVSVIRTSVKELWGEGSF